MVLILGPSYHRILLNILIEIFAAINMEKTFLVYDPINMSLNSGSISNSVMAG